jgi:hypothetical protein
MSAITEKKEKIETWLDDDGWKWFKESFSDSSLPECDGSYQDCVTERGDVCEAGSTDHECELDG